MAGPVARYAAGASLIVRCDTGREEGGAERMMFRYTARMSEAYWDTADRALLDRARSYSDLLSIAERVIRRMPTPVVQVCGPITTGGLGSFEKNIEALRKAIAHVSQLGHHVFDQTPFQQQMERIKDGNGNGEAYDHDLLLEFYKPLFEKRLIEVLYFMPGWETSIGGKWEHEEAQRLGIRVQYL